MASVFTYQEDVKRIHSPWSTPGNTTPQPPRHEGISNDTGYNIHGVTRLEPEKQDGPCEYKLHLLLRARRKFASMTTIANEPSYMHMNGAPAASSALSPSDVSFHRSTYQPSSQTRQIRLQQLTTQLLWRLQQSSPFHSSSNAQLVLPLLPEAAPRLGVPERPAKLLPGLEESQGALYELGVADDGTLVGLVEDELEESLNNLRAMAASLGSVCEILLKTAIGYCEWFDSADHDIDSLLHRGELFVTEVLVRPDSRAVSNAVSAAGPETPHTEFRTEPDGSNAPNIATGSQQLRIAFAGSSTAGKSSLVGTLATSILDNGRGKSRLSLLKHRHEIASGITSSVAHELIGYKSDTEAEDLVVNYATGDVSSWTDIHNLADRLCFMIDSPGLPRYAKSVFRSLVSWDPHWTILCVAADESEDSSIGNGTGVTSDETAHTDTANLSEGSLAHLSLCLRLDLPIIVAITKMDVATKAGLRLVLGKVLSALKMANRQPMLLSSASPAIPTSALDSNRALRNLQHIGAIEQAELDDVLDFIVQGQSRSIVPIVMTSAVNGTGVGKLHGLLRTVPNTRSHFGKMKHGGEYGHCPLFHVDEVFSIPPSRVYSSDTAKRLEVQGIVLCGRLECGKISVGDHLHLGPIYSDKASTDSMPPWSKSYSAQDTRRTSRSTAIPLAKSLQGDGISVKSSRSNAKAVFAIVRVVSLRDLRLPVLSMQLGETGTIGIELVHDKDVTVSLLKARKGLVLLGAGETHRPYGSFTARFPATDFVSSSPPLILGGHAIVYINSIRAAVKVMAVALADDETEPSSPAILFSFDGDEDDEGEEVDAKPGVGHQENEVVITFRFVSTVEWMNQGDRVLVVPTASTTGLVAGPVGATGGLAGYVGSISEVHI